MHFVKRLMLNAFQENKHCMRILVTFCWEITLDGMTFENTVSGLYLCRYCNQVLDKEIDNCCTLLLQELVRFQDRLYHKDPVKVKNYWHASKLWQSQVVTHYSNLMTAA